MTDVGKGSSAAGFPAAPGREAGDSTRAAGTGGDDGPIGVGEPPAQALAAVFGERFGHGPVARRNGARSETGSNYEIHRELIVAAYRESGGNVSATLRALESRGLAFSRRWLAEYLEKWGIR